MKPVVIHSEAIAELDGAIAYYDDQKVGLGLDFWLKWNKQSATFSKVQV